MSTPGVVIVGAGLAGVRTAEQLRASGYGGAVTLVGAESQPPYDRPPLSKQVLRGERPVVRLREPESYAELDVDVRLGVAAVRLDPVARTLELRDGTSLGYGNLVIATGAAPRRLPGTDHLAGVHVLRTADDAERLRTAAAETSSAVVVGGGFIGCEVAASLRTMGLDVTIVELGAAPLAPVLGERVAAYVVDLLRSEGVQVVTATPVAALDGDDRVEAVRLADGGVIKTELVVVGLGVVPEVGWLDGSGIELGDGVRCEARGRTSLDAVWALGDVAAWHNPRTGKHRRVEHWTTAVEQAQVVAADIATGEAVPYDAVPYFWSDQFRVKIQSLGVPSPDADVTIVELTEKKRVALYSQGGVLTAAVGFSSPSAVMALRPMLAEPTPVDEAVRATESRRTVSA